MPPKQRRKGMPASLKIDTPSQNANITVVVDDDMDTSTLSSNTSDSDYPPFRSASRSSSMRNLKGLSIGIPSAGSSDSSLGSAAKLDSFPQSSDSQPSSRPERPRRPSVISLPGPSNPVSSLLHRKEEDGGGDVVPYVDGPIQIIPGIWIGSEDNARDWKGLIERGIKAILNVAKEVSSPFDTATRSLRTVSSTPDFRKPQDQDSTYYPPHLPSGRPGMHYLKLQWSHGQQDLVNNGFQAAFAFTDAALARSDGVLVHCQCGISRSATMVIALVMRAAAQRSPFVPPEVWALKGMQGAYSFVKERSPAVGPNMSLIYQLLDYEKTLKGDSGSDSEDSYSKEEEEWSRLRREMDEASGSEHSDDDESVENSVIMQEARALDKAMEDRIVARKSSISSIRSTGSGIGMGVAWRSRYSRQRTGSIASNRTNVSSVISEDLLEEEEEEVLLGVGGGFDSNHGNTTEESSTSNSPDDEVDDANEITFFAPLTATVKPPLLQAPPPPSAPAWKTSFDTSGPPPSAPAWRSTFKTSLPPPPATAVRATFGAPAPPPAKPKKRPLSISVLPTVPPSPIIVEQDDPPPSTKPSIPVLSKLHRRRTESQKLVPPPLSLRNSLLKRASAVLDSTSSSVSTPSQTLFVFPPSPTLTTKTPSTMTLTSEVVNTPVPFPTMPTPRISTFRQKGGRTTSFIGVGSPPTPTVGFSKVDARGYVGFNQLS